MSTRALNRTLLASAMLAAVGAAKAQHSAIPIIAEGTPDAALATVRIDASALQAAGTPELGKALQALDGAFNFPATFMSGGTDIIRPGTLGGLGPDQVLVLVNGKRRHQHAVLNVQQSVGRGSAGVDFNAIPVSAIDHIEVLHGDAVTRYGSDATAGVINIVLKHGVREGQLAAMTGATAQGDGKLAWAGASRGFALGTGGGYLDLSLEGTRRGETGRAGPDQRVDPARITQHIGDIATRDGKLWINAALPTGAGGELYAFGGASKRSGDGYALFRAKDDPRNAPALYPDGFAPGLFMTVRDAALALGYRRDLRDGWKLDLSVNHGRNDISFGNRQSLNVSYWYEKPHASPTEADAGQLAFTQTTVNADLSGPVTLMGSRIDLTGGVEYRRDGYRIVAGEPVSYQYGRTNNRALWIGDQSGQLAAPGMQGFAGYTPADAIDASRRNVAFYLDTQQKIGKHLVLGSTMRRERYSDIRDVATGNLAVRYEPVPALGLRAAWSTGFRAPSVHQKFYSSSVTDLNTAGAMTQTLTVRESGAVASALGLPPLVPEVSKTASVALVLRPAANFSLSANAYRTRLYNRIVLSSPIAAESGYCRNPAACPVRRVRAPLGADQVQLFANAIDTVTRGLDLVAEHTMRGAGKTLTLSGQLGFNRTEVVARYTTSPLISAARLFSDSQVTLVERGQPRQHHVIKADLEIGRWNLGARANYYGEVQGQGYTAPYIQTWDASWLLHLSLRHAITRRLSVTAGADNVLDTYPGKWDRAKAAPYPQMGFTNCRETCPFGVNGRTMYVRVDFSF
jgi:iron complex outermembrane receptor protein